MGFCGKERERGGRVLAQRSAKNFAIGLSKEAWVKEEEPEGLGNPPRSFCLKSDVSPLQGEFAYL